jgi:hypothetical protein
MVGKGGPARDGLLVMIVINGMTSIVLLPASDAGCSSRRVAGSQAFFPSTHSSQVGPNNS